MGDISMRVEELYEAVGRAIDASGHARFIAESIKKRTDDKKIEVLYVKLGGVKKNLEEIERALERLRE